MQHEKNAELAVARMESDKRVAKLIEDMVTEMFYGGHHPDYYQVGGIVEAILKTHQYHINNQRDWEPVIVSGIMKRLG